MSVDNEPPDNTKDDACLSCGDQVRCQEQRSIRTSFGLQSATQEIGIHSNAVFTCDKSQFLKVLTEAEMAANAAAIQVVSFKDAMEDEFDDSRPAATDKRRFVRQRGLLLEKLEDFKRQNKSVRQKLKQLQDSEVNRIETNQRIEILTNKITEAEKTNDGLRKDVTAAERKIEELLELRREEQEKTQSVLNLNKSGEATRAHLQGQLRNKEAENNRLTVQLRSLERTQMEQKLTIDNLNYNISALRKTAENEQESLKKACQTQKLRAQKFEAAIEKYYDKLKEKDLQLTSARLELDSRRQTKEKNRNETDNLVAHIDVLKSEVSDLTARLQREEEKHLAATETLMQHVKKLTTENEELGSSYATLEASVRKLEQQLADCESALVEETVVSQERKLQLERAQYQVAELQAEVENLNVNFTSLSRQTKLTQDEKDVEVLKMESHTKFLRSSIEMRESMHKASLQLQDKVDSLHEHIEKLREENLELVQKLATQEEALRCSHDQLEQRSSECQALTRQLEAALLDAKQQVNKAKEQALSKEEGLQTKILELEAEKSRQNNEMRLLHQSKHMAEKQFEVRLKDLQLSLDRSESNKQSVQNYVDFLKQFYTTVFDDRLQRTRLGASYFTK